MSVVGCGHVIGREMVNTGCIKRWGWIGVIIVPDG